jgi:hypothetical protein
MKHLEVLDGFSPIYHAIFKISRNSGNHLRDEPDIAVIHIPAIIWSIFHERKCGLRTELE